MYQDFYDLAKAPFRITPDPEFFCATPSQQEAMAAVIYGVEQRRGVVAIIGEVGLGKTTLLRAYLEGIDRTRLTPVYILNPAVPFAALLEAIFRELGLADTPAGVHLMVHRLHQVFIDEYRQGRNVVLIVDEAQNMPVDTLENLRLLSNLETTTAKLIQIVLVGQPELGAKLRSHNLRQLNQRVAIRSTLSPFTDRESVAYIGERLSRAGVSTPDLFTPGALRRIVRQARGIPRTLNVLCDNALITGLGYQRKPVTARIVEEVIADLEGRTRAPHRRWIQAAILAMAVAGGAMLLGWSFRDVLMPPLASAPLPAPSVSTPPPVTGDGGGSRPLDAAVAR